MPFELRITDLGRAALVDGENRGTNAIRLTKMAIGSGSGPGGEADDARTTLRTLKATVELTGTTTVSGRIAVRGVFNPTEAYDVTEVGILGRVGAGAEELYAYWTDGGTKIAATLIGTRLVIAGSLDIAPAAAEVTVMISASISLGDPALQAAVTAVAGRVGYLEAADMALTDADIALAEADTALETRLDALETPDFAAQIQELTDRVQQAEEASVIRSIQRGETTLSSNTTPPWTVDATIAQVDIAKSVVILNSLTWSTYGSQTQFGNRVSVLRAVLHDATTLQFRNAEAFRVQVDFIAAWQVVEYE